MKKLFIYILILISFKSYAQKDSIEIKGQMVAIEDRPPVDDKAFGLLWERERAVDSLFIPRVILPNRFEPKKNINVGFYYKLFITPSTQISLKENLINISQDTLLKLYYRHFWNREFKPNIKDTLSVLEDDIAYIKDETKGNGSGDFRAGRFQGFYSSPSLAWFYGLLLINKVSKDTLNGLCKVQASLRNQKSYDYYMGYFNQGSPYLDNHHNVFEYYKGNTLVKRRFIKGSNPGGSICTEDYIPLGKKHWQREIKVLGEKHISLRDTIVYKGKLKTKRKFLLITQEKYDDYELLPNVDSLQFIRSEENFKIHHIFEDDKYPKAIIVAIYKSQDSKLVNGHKKYSSDKDKKLRVYSQTSPSYYQSMLDDFSRSIAEIEEILSPHPILGKRKYDYRHFFTDTLEYTEQKAYIDGKQTFYVIDYSADTAMLQRTDFYRKGKLLSSYDYNKAYIRKTKYRPKKKSVIDNISYEGTNDSLALKHLNKLVPEKPDAIPKTIGRLYLRDYKKGVYILKVNNVIRYHFSKTSKINRKNDMYKDNYTIKLFDKNGRLISEQKNTSPSYFIRY